MYSILIVDDEKAIRENLSKAIPFDEYGFFIGGTAANGAEALELLPVLKPDMILLDVCMPVMDGLGFLKELKKTEYSDTIVIMLSGYSDFEYAKKAMRYGAKGYVTKPVDEEILPLLTEMNQELRKSSYQRLRKTQMDDLRLLNMLYNGKSWDRSIFGKYILVHCIILKATVDDGEDNPYSIVQNCMENLLKEYGNCLFRTKGCILTYLIPKEIFHYYDESEEIFAKHLLYLLREEKLQCSLLLDKEVFGNSDSAFREDYNANLYTMMTEVFYGKTGVIDITKLAKNNRVERLNREEYFMEQLRRYLLELDKASIQREFDALMEEIEGIRLRIEYIQEINFRIYYLLADTIASESSNSREEPILTPPEWLDYIYFYTFDKWKMLQLSGIEEAFRYIESRRSIANLGVCGNIIEYVHRHFREPITLQQVAENFYMNSAYLGQIFQKATGESFKRYVNNLRIAEAKRLLKQTDGLIYEIAYQVGYVESKYFIEKFVAHVGMSPTEYRKAIV
jgi:two-component system response regulator YesN